MSENWHRELEGNGAKKLAHRKAELVITVCNRAIAALQLSVLVEEISTLDTVHIKFIFTYQLIFRWARLRTTRRPVADMLELMVPLRLLLCFGVGFKNSCGGKRLEWAICGLW